MADIVDAKTRSRMMSGIRSKDTKPELTVRLGLHHRGFRYRLHDRRLPGTPDLFLPKYSAVIFVHGCFWHGHDCAWFKWPKTRSEFWQEKIQGNRARDQLHQLRLNSDGWRVCVVWECALRAAGKDTNAVLDKVTSWLRSDSKLMEIRA